jgi:hypothetical protein
VKTLLIILITSSLIACKQASKHAEHPNQTNIPLAVFSKDTQLDLYSASITIPKGWRRTIDDTLVTVGDATVRYRFHNKKGILVFLQYGLSTIGNPAETSVVPARFRKGYIRNSLDTSEIIFTDNPGLNKIRENSKYTFFSRNIGTFQATIFDPKRTGNGYTGMYIDSIGEVAGNIADLVLYAENLDSLENIELEKVIGTLVLKHFD